MKDTLAQIFTFFALHGGHPADVPPYPVVTPLRVEQHQVQPRRVTHRVVLLPKPRPVAIQWVDPDPYPFVWNFRYQLGPKWLQLNAARG